MAPQNWKRNLGNHFRMKGQAARGMDPSKLQISQKNSNDKEVKALELKRTKHLQSPESKIPPEIQENEPSIPENHKRKTRRGKRGKEANESSVKQLIAIILPESCK